jgi:hypothetical protein
MKSIGSVLSKINIADDSDKFLSREFQQYGILLSEKLADAKHKALYIKMAKEMPRQLLDDALSFVLDSQADSKARLFMWKVARLKAENKSNKAAT